MKDFLHHFACNQLGIYTTIIGIFTYNVLLERDMACTCEGQMILCYVYLILPVVTILVLILWMDKTSQRTSGSFCHCFIKALLVGLLWIVSVFIDGDWYVCCMNDHSEQQVKLACRDKDNFTAEEQTIIAELKNFSKVFGFSMLFLIISVAALLSHACCWRKCSNCCYGREVLYDKLILEEEEHVLEEILRTAAKETLTQIFIDKIGERKWKECFNVAKELKSTEPTLSEQQQRQWEEWKRKREETVSVATTAAAQEEEMGLQSNETESLLSTDQNLRL